MGIVSAKSVATVICLLHYLRTGGDDSDGDPVAHLAKEELGDRRQKRTSTTKKKELQAYLSEPSLPPLPKEAEELV